MQRTDRIILFTVAGLLLASFVVTGIPGAMPPDMNNLLSDSASFIVDNEGFRAHPYPDADRYSWGYGTLAPGPTGTITQEQAMNDLLDHVQNDYDTLSPLITRNLTANQWVALLDFSYNEGVGAAQKLLHDLNSGDDAKLEAHMKLYIYSEHQVDDRLVARRDSEWELFIS